MSTIKLVSVWRSIVSVRNCEYAREGRELSKQGIATILEVLVHCYARGYASGNSQIPV